MVFWLNLTGALLIWLASALNENILLWWLLPLAWLAVIILELLVFKSNQTMRELSKIVFWGVLFIFLYSNPLIIGLYILSVGQIMNMLVKIANGFWMPAKKISEKQFFPQGYIEMSNITRLNFLGDFIFIPFPWEGDLVSPGDLLICLGSYIAIIELIVK